MYLTVNLQCIFNFLQWFYSVSTVNPLYNYTLGFTVVLRWCHCKMFPTLRSRHLLVDYLWARLYASTRTFLPVKGRRKWRKIISWRVSAAIGKDDGNDIAWYCVAPIIRWKNWSVQSSLSTTNHQMTDSAISPETMKFTKLENKRKKTLYWTKTS